MVILSLIPWKETSSLTHLSRKRREGIYLRHKGNLQEPLQDEDKDTGNAFCPSK